MTFEVTPLHASSLVALAQCHIDCWRESYRGLVGDHILNAFDVGRVADQWRRTPADLYTVEAGDAVVGFAAASEPELHALYVRKSLWGKGIADSLIEAAIGDRSVRLWVFEANLRAQRFYRKHGFTPDQVTALEPFTGLPEIRMSR